MYLMRRQNRTVWVVTYCDSGTEPVVTVFDNYLAANSCYKFFKDCHSTVCIDECYIASNFAVGGRNDVL